MDVTFDKNPQFESTEEFAKDARDALIQKGNRCIEIGGMTLTINSLCMEEREHTQSYYTSKDGEPERGYFIKSRPSRRYKDGEWVEHHLPDGWNFEITLLPHAIDHVSGGVSGRLPITILGDEHTWESAWEITEMWGGLDKYGYGGWVHPFEEVSTPHDPTDVESRMLEELK